MEVSAAAAAPAVADVAAIVALATWAWAKANCKIAKSIQGLNNQKARLFLLRHPIKNHYCLPHMLSYTHLKQ